MSMTARSILCIAIKAIVHMAAPNGTKCMAAGASSFCRWHKRKNIGNTEL